LVIKVIQLVLNTISAGKFTIRVIFLVVQPVGYCDTHLLFWDWETCMRRMYPSLFCSSSVGYSCVVTGQGRSCKDRNQRSRSLFCIPCVWL